MLDMHMLLRRSLSAELEKLKYVVGIRSYAIYFDANTLDSMYTGGTLPNERGALIRRPKRDSKRQDFRGISLSP